MQKTIIPPQCLGIMGGGQLGRMFAIAAKQMGYAVAVIEPDMNCPSKQFADYYIATGYEDQEGLDKLASLAAVVTTEFENVPAASLAYLGSKVSVYPSASAILIAQNRLAEKQFFNNNGIATTKYIPIKTTADIDLASTEIFPAILKTNTLGYDGKGQVRVNSTLELNKAFKQLGQATCILEKLVDLELEVSIIVSRNSNESQAYPVAENIHKNGILDITICPARIDNILAEQITQAGLKIIEQLNYTGVLAIEFFITKDGQILANEMAPRPHNSGHHTIDACITSQFEQQVRAICNLKLGKTELFSKCIMLNLLGDIWQNSNTHPQWDKLLTKYSNLKLHLYDKAIAKAGRKMGHLTILGDNIDELLIQIEQIKQELNIG